MKTLLALLMVCVAAGCASKKKIDLSGEGEETPAFDQGLKALEREDYQQASKIFDELLIAKPASEKDLVITYNSGAAHEGLGHCAKAAERYREVVRSSAGKFKEIEGMALFRMSLMYECLGQDTKAITALLDARKRGKELSFETRNAEIPARLAAAYARINNKQKAIEYFAQASEGLKKIVGQTSNHKQKELLARTLFLMGQLNSSQRAAEVPPASYMQSVSMQQPYLLQAAELDHKTWSKRAGEDLITAYDNIWRFKIEDPAQRREFYTRGLQAVQELKKIRLPNANAAVNSIYAQVEKTEVLLHTELAKVAEVNKLTPAAEAREGLKRTGRVVDPPGTTKKPKAKR